MNETVITIVGNVVDEPKLRLTPERGMPVANFRVASTERRRNRDTGEWQDADTVFLNVTCWRRLAENVAPSIHKGDPVIVHGRLYTRPYEHQGQKRSSYDVEAYSVGPDLARGTATFVRGLRSDSGPAYAVEGELAPVVDPDTGELIEFGSEASPVHS